MWKIDATLLLLSTKQTPSFTSPEYRHHHLFPTTKATCSNCSGSFNTAAGWELVFFCPRLGAFEDRQKIASGVLLSRRCEWCRNKPKEIYWKRNRMFTWHDASTISSLIPKCRRIAFFPKQQDAKTPEAIACSCRPSTVSYQVYDIVPYTRPPEDFFERHAPMKAKDTASPFFDWLFPIII
eukprot:scaffold2219_cov177-Amphora_coffeaeformis.AAC.6